ncbi:MAG: chorismate synthase [Vampirovibrionales bacterium]|nr:chorismate synthase [Vampirovibrionales bacterium]
MASFRFLTAGESHGPGLTVIVDGVPAGLRVTQDALNRQLARRQLGYGRGGRMIIETDQATILGGVRFEKTTGAPIALLIENRDWKNWESAMASGGEWGEAAEQKKFMRPRPGHADLAAYYKYGLSDLRDALERASARETAARTAAGAIAREILAQIAGIEVYSHVTRLGGVDVDRPALDAEFGDDWQSLAARAEANDLRCAGSDAILSAMRARIDQARRDGVTLGGEVEIIAVGAPPGLGSYAQWDRRLDGRLAQAVMSVQAVKSVTIGAGDDGATRAGDVFHDEIVPGGLSSTQTMTLQRPTNRAGGLEAGVSNGRPVIVRAVMKPIATMRKALASVNLETGESEAAHFERSDVTAVAACGVVCEAMTAFTLAQALLEKFGEDTVEDASQALLRYRERLRPPPAP